MPTTPFATAQRATRRPAGDELPAPDKKRSYGRRWLAGALVALTVASGATALSATSAQAYGTSLSCTGRSMTQPFKGWSDYASYFRLSNGGFESGTSDWRLSGGAAVVAGNETWKVSGPGDANSLRIPAGGIAESRALCVSMGEDTIRLFVRNAKVPGSILHVEAQVRNPSNGRIAQTAFDVNGDASPSGWAPTMILMLPNLLNGSGQQELTLTFTTRGTSATWFIDDVFVDPFKSY
jgi:hypothetical protein